MWPFLFTFAVFDMKISQYWGNLWTNEYWWDQWNSRNPFVVNCLPHMFICRRHTWLTWTRILSCLSVCSTTSKTALQGNLHLNNDLAAVALESSGNSPWQGVWKTTGPFLWWARATVRIRPKNLPVETICLCLKLPSSPLCPFGALYRIFLLSHLLHL